MTHVQIRKKFLEFFKSKKHTIVASDTLVPAGDATVLFTSAGMNQFKEQFLGNVKDFSKAASCQRCLRTDDLKNVGVTSYHHTFFEMLGNFSFGDYFKKEAILWAWEFLTKVLKLSDDKLWVSVYKDDDEAYQVWKEEIKISASRIVKLGDKENFWPAEAKEKGPNGPCGPCSEIFYDYGGAVGCGKENCTPACDCGRFVEVWNLVFTQFNRKEGGKLTPLPKKNIDTGMGLERLCAVMQGVENNFETDIFLPIIAAIKTEVSNITGEEINFNKHKKDIYAIADHLRAVSFAICDGIVPSNEERGYVIRNLIRKSALYGMNLGIKEPFLYKIIASITKVMQGPYPDLKKRRENISQIVLAEEERFISTLKEGLGILEDKISRLKENKTVKVSGEFAFKLFDTHGFPFDLTQTALAKHGLTADEKEFNELMKQQREQSRKGSQIADAIFKESLVQEKTEFTGYEKLEVKAKAIKIFKDGKHIQQLKEGQRGEVVLDKSPFYGESGGQVGDAGTLKKEGLLVKVLDAKKESDAILLKVQIEKGTLKEGDLLFAKIDEERRSAIVKNHSATHLLQSALREVLGDHVQQQGSLVLAEKLRFDFTHFKALSTEELDRVQEIVNKRIKQGDAVASVVMDIEKAKASGALAFFGDKYEKNVRMVSAGGYSKELCGGTHVKNTKEIGVFKIISEGSVASGIRRIEAVTDKAALAIVNQQQQVLENICAMLECNTQDAVGRLKKLLLEFDKLQKNLKNAALKEVRNSTQTLIDSAQKINGVIFIFSNMHGASPTLLRNAVDVVKEKLKAQEWIAFFGSINGEQAPNQQGSSGQASLILAVSKDLAGKGIHAGKVISKIAKATGGSGGGREDMAQAGVKEISNLENALKEGRKIILEELEK